MPQAKARTRRKPIDESTEDTYREVIVGMYEMLQDAFANYLPELSDQLCPTLAGWVYEPTWEGPRPPGDYTGYKSDLPRIFHGREPKPRIDSERGLLMSDNTFLLGLRMVYPAFAEIENGIYRRFWALGVQFRAPEILSHAITVARLDLQTDILERKAERTAFEHRDFQQDRISSDITEHFQRQEQFKRRIRLLRVRIFWLKQWFKFEEGRAARLAGERITRSAVDNYAALIKPSDLREVRLRFDETFSRSWRIEPEDILDPQALILRTRDESDERADVLRQLLLWVKTEIVRYDCSAPPSEHLVQRLCQELSYSLKGDSFYPHVRHLEGIKRDTHEVGIRSPKGPDAWRLNRTVLDDLFPDIFKNSREKQEAEHQDILKLLAFWYCKTLWQCGADSKARRAMRLRKSGSFPKYDRWLNKVKYKLRRSDSVGNEFDST